MGWVSCELCAASHIAAELSFCQIKAFVGAFLLLRPRFNSMDAIMQSMG